MSRKRLITENTIKLNDAITKLTSEFNQRRKYAFVPYDTETGKIKDIIDEEDSLYTDVENKILQDFTQAIQKNDIEIDNLREKHRLFVAKYNADKDSLLRKHKKAIHTINKKFDNQIMQARKAYLKTKKRKNKLAFVSLNKAKKKEIIKENNEFITKSNQLNAQYINSELDFIKQIETLRTQKTEFETIKSSSIKSLTAEHVTNQTIHSNDLKEITKSKNNFVASDELDESKRVLTLRLNRDIEAAYINFDIAIFERDMRVSDYLDSYHIYEEKERANYLKQLADINLEYQKQILKARSDFANITNMLESQKNVLINDYNSKVCYKKMDHERTKLNFYIECDNIQYQLYKLTNAYQNKRIDTEIYLNDKLALSKRNFLNLIKNNDIISIENDSIYAELMARINLYNKRLEVEKVMISNAFELFVHSFEKIIHVENTLLAHCGIMSEHEFKNVSQTILTCAEYLRQIKTALLEEYYKNEVSIINTRINFEKDVKYTKVLDSITNEKRAFFEQINRRKEKLIQTSSNYSNTIDIFEKNIFDLQKEALNIKEKIKESKLSKKDDSFTEKYKASYANNILKQANYKAQIKKNKKNISDLNNALKKLNKEIKVNETKFQNQIDLIYKSQALESKVYYDTITLIKQQYNQLLWQINWSTTIINPSHFTFKYIISVSNKAISNNNKLINNIRNYYNTHYEYMNNAVTKHIKNLETNYIETFERNNNNNTARKENERTRYQDNIQEINDEHQALVSSITLEYEKSKDKLYQELKKLNQEQLNNQKKFNRDIENLTIEHKNNLLCHDENVLMYDKSYKEKTKRIRNEYTIGIANAKKTYTKNLKNIDIDLNNFKKNDDIQRTRINQLRKNTIAELRNEYREMIKISNRKIHEIHHNDHLSRVENDAENNALRSQFINNKKGNRFELVAQLKQIEINCKKRIILEQRNFKKEFKKKNIH